MAFKLLTGPYLNNLTRMASAATTNPSMHTLFPVTHAYDNRSAKAAMFSAAQDDSVVTFNQTMVQGGGFESDADVAEWTVLGVGSQAKDATSPHAGTYSLLITPGGSAVEVITYQDVLVRAGEELTFQAAAKAGTGDAVIRIRNRQTGNWLDTNGAWQASVTALFTETGGSWQTCAETFTVESLSTCKEDTVYLRIFLRGDQGTARFDQVALFPSVNWASVHGHNIPPFIVPTLQRSTDGSSWTTETTMTLRRDSFHASLASLKAYQYWRLLFDGRPDTGSLMHVGEIVLGQSFDMGHNPAYGAGITWTEKQTRLETDLGEPFVHLHNVKAPQRSMVMTINTRGDTEYESLYKTIFRGSRGGGNLICIAPTEMDSGVAILGRVQEALAMVKSTPDWRTGELEVTELPLPSVPDVVHAYDAPVEDPV